jgi:hypothetical protein
VTRRRAGAALVVAVAAALSLRAPAAAPPALPSGAEIMAKVNARPRGDAARLVLGLTLTDPKRGEFHKRIEIQRRGGTSGHRTVFRIAEPDHEQGIVLLVAEEPELDGFWMYFPRSDRLLRVATRGLSALGSDFSCEDLRWILPLDEYVFRTLGRVDIDGHPGFRVEMRPATERLQSELGFQVAIGWIRADEWIVVRSDYYDAEGRLFKTFRAERVERVQGIWTVLESTMVNHRIDHRSRAVVDSVEYRLDPQPDASLFQPEGLARVSRRGG